MLSIYSVPEALEFLKAKTGEDWSDSKLFDTVCKLHLTLRAAAPHDAMTEIRVFENGKFAVKDFGGGLLASRMGWRMAVLHPVHVAQVWQTGTTETIHSVGNGGPQGEIEEIHMLGIEHAGKTKEHWWFTKPVAVTRETVRVTPWALNYILSHMDRSQDAGQATAAGYESLAAAAPMQEVAVIAPLAPPAPAHDYAHHPQTNAAVEIQPSPPQPAPLPTKVIGELFDRIEFTKDRWIKNIGTAAWLSGARRARGERGGASATWCPLAVATAIHSRMKSATPQERRNRQKVLNALNSRFNANPVLSPWLNAWNGHYSMFSDRDEG